ncbi:MAG: tyrosine-type recombinase/integrase [Sedimentisphaerales bacterium]|nr:tyrosine-type recombinase/integrase [Sedimentisphaerales bacterium]
MSSVWVTKRPGKRGMRYLVRWIEPTTGKNRSKTFRRREDARDFKAKLNRDFEYNEYFAPVKISYAEWVKRHLENMANSPDVDVAPKTIAGHKEALEALGEACKPRSPRDINPKMIRNFKRILLESGLENKLSPNTINKYIRAIRSALSYAVRDEIILENKLIGRHRLLLRTERKAPRILEVGEIVALMNVITDLRHRAVVSLAYYHGLRRGEICYLRWQDIHFEDNRLEVVSREEFRTKKRKNHTVALRQETAELLSRLAQDRVNEYVFTKTQAFYDACKKWFPKAVALARLDHCTLHDLRRTCNTQMLDAGVPREAAMQVLGHTSVQVNQDYYTGYQIEQQRIAINSLPSIG